MTREILLDLDDVDAARLQRYSSIKNSNPQAVARRLIQDAINDWIETLDDDGCDQMPPN